MNLTFPPHTNGKNAYLGLNINMKRETFGPVNDGTKKIQQPATNGATLGTFVI